MQSTPPSERVRTRAQRVASKVSYVGLKEKMERLLYSDAGLAKLGLVFLTSLLICAICAAWDPPFRYRKYQTPERDVVSSSSFEFKRGPSSIERQRARSKATRYYINDPQLLIDYKVELVNRMQQLISVPDYASCSQDDLDFLRDFLPSRATEEAGPLAFEKFKNYFAEDENLEKFSRGLDAALLPFEKIGVLRYLPSERDDAPVHNLEKQRKDAKQASEQLKERLASEQDATEEAELAETESATEETELENPDESVDKVKVYYAWEQPENAREEAINVVMLGAAPGIARRLRRSFNDPEVVALLARKLRSSIPETLTKDYRETRRAQDDAESKLDEVLVRYESGDPLIRANHPINVDELKLLRAERDARLVKRTFGERLARFLSVLALVFFLMFGSYFLMFNKLLSSEVTRRRHQVRECAVFFLLMLLFLSMGRGLQYIFRDVATCPEIVPLLIFIQITAIASSWDVAITFGTIVAFALTLAVGSSLSEFIVYVGVGAVVALASRNIRARVELFLVALTSGLIAFLLSIASNFAVGESSQIVGEAVFCGVWGFLAGFITSGVLPLFERMFGILTPMRLLEYSNPSHQLLLELNRRAPATYSHSIQTAALAEPAAEAIRARSALVRVGAYFHDVGKMLQPEHFTENQRGYNIHDDLEPRMSALVIVAHVKDGSDLARRYQLPRQIVDLVEQHHGTMRVGFFYNRAIQAAQEQDPDGATLDDAPFRYPGPIPQTKEAGVLMIADATESASRSLSDWSPRRLENLVHKIVEERIEDGQLNDSGLTLGEIHAIEQSLVNTLLASHHTRVKYPETKDAREQAKDVNKDQAKDGKRVPNAG